MRSRCRHYRLFRKRSYWQPEISLSQWTRWKNQPFLEIACFPLKDVALFILEPAAVFILFHRPPPCPGDEDSIRDFLFKTEKEEGEVDIWVSGGASRSLEGIVFLSTTSGRDGNLTVSGLGVVTASLGSIFKLTWGGEGWGLSSSGVSDSNKAGEDDGENESESEGDESDMPVEGSVVSSLSKSKSRSAHEMDRPKDERLPVSEWRRWESSAPLSISNTSSVSSMCFLRFVFVGECNNVGKSQESTERVVWAFLGNTRRSWRLDSGGKSSIDRSR